MKKNIILGLIIGFSALAGLSTVDAKTSTAFGQNIINTNIKEEEVQAAQEAWGKALIHISKDFDLKGIEKATETAKAVIDSAYGYDLGTVLFKPTLASGEQTFRTTKAGALSYFVGGNKSYPEDKGFALKGWTKYEFKNAGVIIYGDFAVTMGNVTLTDKSGKITKFDKTWGFKKDRDGNLKIVLHHSSVPYVETGKGH